MTRPTQAGVAGVSEVVNEIGEGPLWSASEQALYWIDSGPAAKTLMRYRPNGGTTDVWRLPQRASSVARRARGGLVIGFQRGLAVMDPASGRIDPVPLDGVDFGQERFNDSAVDRAGRLWIGSFDRALKAPIGVLYRVAPGQPARAMDRGFMMSNGIAWSPDNRTLYFCDSRPGRIYAYDFDADAGAILGRRVFMDFEGRAGRPDGCAMDSQGFLWVAEVGAGQILRLDPAGRIERALALPVSKPTSIAFGGEGLRTLFITSMTFGLTEAQRQEQALAGRLLAVDAGVSGLEEPAFDL
ncbi:SMP-30/gluconolactonase/LRE family protein [Pigmentiphaga soli]|uniref:SMP-30/gluconolactonase/LRE family protein n=1 Tax=Pigmentiphaga soli TaxID=1007095 RepID=A0ABP8GMK0_9BURK